ncbi:MAG: hypothetical protein DRH93_03305 [Deltaproteobacteria bacterium]|nr:MAG: hypothetical protein DRH93_03305 [Deltaproteobacteria bacterium]
MARKIYFPIYLYHKEYDTPKRVDNRAQMTDLQNKGWVNRYIKKEYPKWVNGIVVRSEAEHKVLLAAEARKPAMKVEVKKTLLDGDNRVIKDSGSVAPVLTKPPTGVVHQVPAQFEIAGPDGNAVEGHIYNTWKEAQGAQRILNEVVPGHKARKKS